MRRRIYELKKELEYLQREYEYGELDHWYNTKQKLYIANVKYVLTPGYILRCEITDTQYRMLKKHSSGTLYQKWFVEPVTK